MYLVLRGHHAPCVQPKRRPLVVRQVGRLVYKGLGVFKRAPGLHEKLNLVLQVEEVHGEAAPYTSGLALQTLHKPRSRKWRLFF